MRKLKKALKLTGSQNKLSIRLKQLGYPDALSQSSISYWLKNGHPKKAEPYIDLVIKKHKDKELNALERAISIAGSQERLVQLMQLAGYPGNVQQQYISYWLKNGVPKRAAKFISISVKSQVSEIDLLLYDPSHNRQA